MFGDTTLGSAIDFILLGIVAIALWEIGKKLLQKYSQNFKDKRAKKEEEDLELLENLKVDPDLRMLFGFKLTFRIIGILALMFIILFFVTFIGLSDKLPESPNKLEIALFEYIKDNYPIIAEIPKILTYIFFSIGLFQYAREIKKDRKILEKAFKEKIVPINEKSDDQDKSKTTTVTDLFSDKNSLKKSKD